MRFFDYYVTIAFIAIYFSHPADFVSKMSLLLKCTIHILAAIKNKLLLWRMIHSIIYYTNVQIVRPYTSSFSCRDEYANNIYYYNNADFY